MKLNSLCPSTFVRPSTSVRPPTFVHSSAPCPFTFCPSSIYPASVVLPRLFFHFCLSSSLPFRPYSCLSIFIRLLSFPFFPTPSVFLLLSVLCPFLSVSSVLSPLSDILCNFSVRPPLSFHLRPSSIQPFFFVLLCSSWSMRHFVACFLVYLQGASYLPSGLAALRCTSP